MSIVKELCVDNIQDAINAFEKGADRIEFCSNSVSYTHLRAHET